MNDFWAPENNNRDRFPLRTDQDGISLRKTLDSWNSWPDATDFFNEDIHPDNSGTPNWTNKGQGITADPTSSNWVFGEFSDIHDPHVWRLPVSVDIDAEITSPVIEVDYEGPNAPFVSFLQQNHFGGIDCFDSQVYVAVHYDGGATASQILRFQIGSAGDSITFDGGLRMPTEGDGEIDQMPWVAILGESGLAWTSPFNSGGLLAYDIDASADWANGGPITPVSPPLDLETFVPSSNTMVEFPFGRRQGGTFGAKGHFYILIDEKDVDGGGIYGIDIISGSVMMHVRPTAFGAPESDGGEDPAPVIPWPIWEYQDLCVFDTTGQSVHPKSEGVLHILIHRNRGGGTALPGLPDLPEDNHTILHLGATVPEDV